MVGDGGVIDGELEVFGSQQNGDRFVLPRFELARRHLDAEIGIDAYFESAAVSLCDAFEKLPLADEAGDEHGLGRS